MRVVIPLIVSLFIPPLFANTYHQHGSENNSLNQALKIGIDTNGKPLYLCIARMFNSTQPGKTWEGYGRCNVAYGGKEYIVTDFQLPSGKFFRNAFWQTSDRDGIVLGHDTNGRPLYVCQTLFKGSMQPGKTWPGYNRCNISYAGVEITMDNYKVLSQDHRGRLDYRGSAQVIVR